MLSAATTRQWRTCGDRAISPPSYPARPTVSRPRVAAASKAARRLRELPLVDAPRAMSTSRPWAMICSEDEVEADVVAEGGQHGLVLDQAAGRAGPPRRRLPEEGGQPAGVG